MFSKLLLRVACREAPLLSAATAPGMKHLLKHIATDKNGSNMNVYDYNRQWLTLPPADPTRTPNHAPYYSLLSYNILAQDLLQEHMQLYVNTDCSLLTWRRRANNLRKEIVQIAPDIICLQEAQYNHLPKLVLGISERRQYEYVFKKKTGRRTDGCAIIYNREKFRLIDELPVEYHQANVNTLNRENIAILTKLQLRAEPRSEFIVATTHLLYNPKRHNVRSAQVKVLLEALNEFSRAPLPFSTTATNQLHVPTLLTGDFNFETHSESYDILTANTVSTSFPALKPVDFGSSSASTFQERWLTVDHVLHSSQIDVRSVYMLPHIEACAYTGQIPNAYLGSDHYSLAMTFSIQ